MMRCGPDADDDPANKGGHIVIVAIADVAHYVTPGSALDREAVKRGNSAYFPDRVVPMLPERLSADLCSLGENEDRPCLAVRMVIDAQGNKRRHEFLRAIMRSAASLTYAQAQRAFDGEPDAVHREIHKQALAPLWSAYKALAIARDRREPLDLDLPERRVEHRRRRQGQIDCVPRPARIHAPDRRDDDPGECRRGRDVWKRRASR